MLLSLVFLAGAFLIFFDLIQPAYGDLQAKKGKEVSARAFLQGEEQLVAQAKKLIDQYASATAAADTLALSMPSGQNLAGALAQLYGIAQNNGLAIQSVSVSPATVVAAQSRAPSQSDATGGAGGTGGAGALTPSQIVRPMGMIAFQVTAAGSYESLKAFLAGIETNIRLFDVTGLAIQSAAPSSGGKGGSANFFTYTITVATYYQLP